MMQQKEKEAEAGGQQVLKRLKYKDIRPKYKIDENGRIFSEYTNKYLKPKKDKDGYLSISLRGTNRTIYTRIATLVAYNFIGPPSSNIVDPTVDHIDGDILNNNYKNLRWLSRSENSSIRKVRGKSLGELNHEAKLTKEEVKKICILLMENKKSMVQIAKLYNVSKSTISNIKRKVKWKEISNQYEFPKIIIKRNSKGRFQKI